MASMRLSSTAACLLAAVLTASCGTSRSTPAAEARISGPEGLEELAPQQLNPGACGMFLWAQSGERPVFVFVALANPAEARVRRDGRDRTLRRTAADGQSEHGHFESQTFSDERITIETDVQFSTTRRLQDGAVIESGVIRVRDREGWETIVPVSGMVACQS